MEKTIVFECEPRPFVVPKGLPYHSERFGSYDVNEYSHASEIAPYGLRMEALVRTKQEAWECRQPAWDLVRDLNKVWPYVAGVPLFPIVLVASLIKSPPGWQTNYDKVVEELPSAVTSLVFTGGGIRIGPPKPYLVHLSWMPLAPALDAVRRFRVADPVTRLIMDFHFDALNQPGSNSRLFLLAKGLELARAMLPGRHDSEKEAALDKEARSVLRQSIHWLRGIANTRLEVRHVVRDPHNLTLHPKLTKEERDDFEDDADVVIRAVIAKQLGIELCVRSRQ